MGSQWDDSLWDVLSNIVSTQYGGFGLGLGAEVKGT